MVNRPRPTWQRTVFRLLYLAYEPDDREPHVAKALTPAGVDRIAQLLAGSGVQAVVFTAKSRRGTALFQTQVPGSRRHEHLQLDYVAAMGAAARAASMRSVAAYSAGADSYQAQAHPNWQVKATGTSLPEEPTPLAVSPRPCLLSPYSERIVLPHLEELVSRYDLDGLWLQEIPDQFGLACYCDHCQRAYRAAGGEAVPVDPAVPAALHYRRWRLAQQAVWEAKVAGRLRALRPELLLALDGGERHPRSGETVADLLLPQCTYDARVIDLSRAGRTLSLDHTPFGQPIPRMLHADDWSLRPVMALQLDCATILASGGRCAFVDQPYPDGSLEPAVLATIGAAADFVHARQPYCTEAKPVTYIAVLHSAATYWARSPLRPEPTALAPVRGALRMLLEGGVHAHVVDEETLARDPARFAAVLLPHQTHLARPTVDLLRRYVEGGGSLIVTSQSGFWDENRQPYPQPALADVCGVEFAGDWPHLAPEPIGYIQPGAGFLVGTPMPEMPLPVREPFVLARAPQEAVLCQLRRPHTAGAVRPPGAETNFPAITAHRLGRGRVVFIASDLFGAYQRDRWPALRHLLARCLDLIVPRERRQLSLEAPPSVEVALWRQADRFVIQLVNATGALDTGGPSVVESVPVLRGVQVLLKVAREPRRVTQQPEGESLAWTAEADRIVIEVPRLHIHSCLVVEF